MEPNRSKYLLKISYLTVITISLFLLSVSPPCHGSLIRKISSNRPYTYVADWNKDVLSVSKADQPSHNLRRRDVSTASSEGSSKIKSSAVPLNDSHNQLLVFWAGQDVILCLAKDANSNVSSTLWVSRNYGESFSNATSLLVPSGGTSVVLEGFFNHPSFNGHFAFTDIQNKYIFTTNNYGANFTANKVEFIPNEVMFDPHSDVNIVAYEKSTKNKQMWVSIDFGKTWTKVQEHVKSLSWDESVMPANLYLQREEPGPSPGERSVILKSDSLFLDPKGTEVIITGVEEFEIKDDFMFATKLKENGSNEYDLLISYQRKEFRKAMFPPNQPTKHFFIADVSTDGQIFVCAVQNESVSNLYIGNFPMNPEENPKFSLSLERILYFKPNVTWPESWLNEVASEPFVDLHHVEGLRGIYIASQLKPSTASGGKFNMNEVISLITFDQGAEWEVLNPPEFEHDGRPIYCQYKSGSNCSLHISQRLNELYPRTRAVPILTKKSAVGLVLATGTVNTTLKGHLGVYLSTDGAVTWRQILQGNYLYAFGDHGGIIVATKMYKIGEDTNELKYSLDEGETWNEYEFYKDKVRIMGLMTEPGENTTAFFIFGSVANSNSTRHTWVLIKIDFKDVFDRNCTKEDYKQWSPWDSKRDRHCLLGRKEIYDRRISKEKCYNGRGYVRPVTNKTCGCTREDFECDFGYVEDSKSKDRNCIKDSSEFSPGVKAEWCKPSESFYNKTKGYRKVPGDICQEGDWVAQYVSETIPCEVKEEPEFLLVAKRDSVLRIDLNHFERVETLPLSRVTAVIAVDFNLKNNCIFWSDVNHKSIMRLHLDGNSTQEVLVSSDIVSVEGLAFDWMSNNLYFTDGGGSKIEVIRTDAMSSFSRRMRKRLLNKPDVDKPRGIAVHPEKGYIFWTDWSTLNPCIGRAHLDGSNIKKIVTNVPGNTADLSVKWPNGITVDYNKHRIYWVDANLDRMMTADFDGGDIKVVLEKDSKISHPFAVGVYKNTVYWDDWTTRAIYLGPLDRDTLPGVAQIKGNLPRLMDLKVYGVGMQQGINNCSTSNCSHICMSSPNQTASCVCPDGFMTLNDTCVCPDGKQPTKGTCESKCDEGTTFKCKTHSHYCIINAWRCDGHDDCGDNSDEEGCEAAVCSDPTEFKCGTSGRCIPRSFICDYDHDCGPGDTSDEENCENHSACDKQKHFQCANGRCILNSWRCDADDDCMDNSDEVNCTDVHNGTFACLPTEFTCPNETKCISTDWLCDFENDCSSGADEVNCTARVCPEWKFTCKSGHCIMKTWECDGDKDCPDESDEHKNCPAVPLTPAPPTNPFSQGNCSTMSQMFECLGSKECVPIYWKCDGVKDCQDGSDEIGCNDKGDEATTVTIEPPKSKCEMDHWRCDDGFCIAAYKVCDGYPDCVGKEDEAACHNSTGGGCPINTKRCGDSRACIMNSQWCDGKPNCPNKADELECPSDVKDSCNTGGFACSDSMCLPLFKKCNGRNDCINGEDEDPEVCNHHYEPVYQVEGLAVHEVDSTWFEIEWWLPNTPSSKKLEFIPEVCELESSHCWNVTTVHGNRSYKVGRNASEKLSPYKRYTVTIYVSDGHNVYPPYTYINVTTTEAESSQPLSLSIRQNTTEDLIISWNKPHFPNGKIFMYKVYFQPPLPPAVIDSDKEILVISNKQSDPVFLPGVNYSFWVTAENKFGEGRSSDVKSYVYNGDVSRIADIKFESVTENSVKLSWKHANDNVDSYVVILETDVPGSIYKFRNRTETTINSFESKHLASGTRYKIILIPKFKGMHGIHRYLSFTTLGGAFAKVDGLNGIPTPKGIVKLTWKAAKLEGATYGVYYGKTVQEMTDKRDRVITNLTQIEVPGLEACENYLFDISLMTPTGHGPLSERPIQVLTKMSPTAPPKSLLVEHADGEARVKVTWNAPCDVMEKAIGYNLTIFEMTYNRTYGLGNVSYSNHPRLSYMVNLQYGGRYQLTVASNVDGGKSSEPVYFDGPAIPFPEKIQECSQCAPLAIYWVRPNLPKLITRKGSESYVVWLSEDENFEKVKKYETNENSFKFMDGLEDRIYFAAVSVKDAEGLESPRSSAIIIQQTGGAFPIVLPGRSALVITITVIGVIVLLVVVLGVIVMRHKRLQTSFLNFASSHYSSHSGAATFQQTVEEQDSPVIRGFSDDEPLLVA